VIRNTALVTDRQGNSQHTGPPGRQRTPHDASRRKTDLRKDAYFRDHGERSSPPPAVDFTRLFSRPRVRPGPHGADFLPLLPISLTSMAASRRSSSFLMLHRTKIERILRLLTRGLAGLHAKIDDKEIQRTRPSAGRSDGAAHPVRDAGRRSATTRRATASRSG
jgi:hypothetical protein